LHRPALGVGDPHDQELAQRLAYRAGLPVATDDGDEGRLARTGEKQVLAAAAAEAQQRDGYSYS